MDPKTEESFHAALRQVAPGTQVREALDNIIAGHSGALVVIGDADGVASICNGGFRVDKPFTAQRLFELAKMDGAITVDGSCETILMANVHLVPDARLPTSETGMRHRAAERTSRQTKALVVSISQRRDIVALYLGGEKVVLQRVEVLLAKADQALQTLQRYRARLDEVLLRLSGLEFEDLVTVDDVAEVIRRSEMVLRVSREVTRHIAELGIEGRLVRMQADELTVGIDEEYSTMLRDYCADPAPKSSAAARTKLMGLPLEKLLETDGIATLLGLGTGASAAETHLRPRGFRLLRKIPMLPGTVIARLVDRFGTLTALMEATPAQLDDVDGVGARRARAVLEGLDRLRRGHAV